MLATGKKPQDGHVGSAMVDVVANLSQLPQEDRDAIARYIKALPARQTPHP
ncbi:diheme cytochrome c-type signal-peptide protein [Bradyrhizobium lupini HPC(L)]|uniref:Diheme cytochrome c-type signal-peptide protein n=2 Tax=Hyphomicrobiales TaxID=356 RepID=A0ABP2RKW2_RHILU|nr:diheme cytochrome c-type signal-peptide protein [Bradyrhizobium lupini HPC(L)]